MNMTTGSKAFVTGGSGFVGRELIKSLRAKGSEVTALARSPKARLAVSQSGAAPVAGDLSDVSALRSGMAGCETVFHAAAEVRDWGPREAFEEATVRGTARVLTAAREAGVSRLVHISTEAVLAGGAPIVDADETAPYPAKPVGLYPWSKGIAEREVVAANTGGFTTIVVRPRMVWGQGDTSLLPPLVGAMRSGQWVWFGGGHHRTSTCHVRNVAEGALLAAERGEGGEIYFLTDGPSVDFRDFITDMVATQGVIAPQRIAPMWMAHVVAAVGESAWHGLKLNGRPPLTRTIVNLLFGEVTVNDRKARERLGYRSHVSIAEGLAEMCTQAV
jgi:nucleoside-diphosphate-sugar epimerase